MDAVSETRIALLAPAFAARLRAGMEAFTAQTGHGVRIVEGLRTYAEQNADFSKGPSVTRAKAGFSWHNFGLAADVVPSIDGADLPYDPDWTMAHPAWSVLVQCLKQAGLAWGGDWTNGTKGDFDHFQYPGIPATPETSDRAAFQIGGLTRVWAVRGLGGVSIQASGGFGVDELERDRITRVILEDLEEGGPISKALEGWVA